MSKVSNECISHIHSLQVLLDHEALKQVLESPYHCKYNPTYCSYVCNASCDVLRSSLHGMAALVTSGTRNFSYKASVTQTVDTSSNGVTNNFLNVPEEVGDASNRQATIPVCLDFSNAMAFQRCITFKTSVRCCDSAIVHADVSA
jgi:hypothetical protein